MTDKPLILWFRRDLRLTGHPMLAAAVATGRPLIPLFILDPETESLGAAPKWRLGLSVDRFAGDLAAIGSRLGVRGGGGGWGGCVCPCSQGPRYRREGST